MAHGRRAALLLLLASSLTAGCNLFSSFEGDPIGADESERRELTERARFMADQGNCVEARNLLINIFPKDDDMNFTLGFAHLCIAGATLESIGTTVAGYTSSSGSDFTVVGHLARKLLAYSSSKETEATSGVTAFQSIIDPNRRGYSTIVGHLSKLAVIVSKAASATGTLEKDSISTAANCTSALACTAGGMNDADALSFKAEVQAMATDAASINLPGLKDLSTALNTSFGSAADAAAIRYLVRTNVVPN